MKKYLVSLFGDFKTQSICNEIALTLSPIVDSPHLKFQYTDGVLLFHFESEMDIKDIHEFLEISSYELYNSFILSEYTDKVSVFLPDMEHLFDLNNFDEKSEQMVVDKKGNTNVEDANDDEDDFVALIVNELKGNLKKPTLDQLLDKIASQGIQSLTPYEKGLLDNYGK